MRRSMKRQRHRVEQFGEFFEAKRFQHVVIELESAFLLTPLIARPSTVRNENRVRVNCLEPAAQFITVHARHANVEYEDVRVSLDAQRERSFRRVRHNDRVPKHLQHFFRHFGDVRNVIYENNRQTVRLLRRGNEIQTGLGGMRVKHDLLNLRDMSDD